MSEKIKPYSKEEREKIMNSLMHSPICPIDSSFKYDIDKSKCPHENCFSCCYDIMAHIQ